MNNTVVPTKEEVRNLLTLMIKSEFIHQKTIGELLGLKLTDSWIPKTKLEPQWGYEGLRKFFVDNNIEVTCTLEEALNKIHNENC